MYAEKLKLISTALDPEVLTRTLQTIPAQKVIDLMDNEVMKGYYSVIIYFDRELSDFKHAKDFYQFHLTLIRLGYTVDFTRSNRLFDKIEHVMISWRQATPLHGTFTPMLGLISAYELKQKSDDALSARAHVLGATKQAYVEATKGVRKCVYTAVASSNDSFNWVAAFKKLINKEGFIVENTLIIPAYPNYGEMTCTIIFSW